MSPERVSVGEEWEGHCILFHAHYANDYTNRQIEGGKKKEEKKEKIKK